MHKFRRSGYVCCIWEFNTPRVKFVLFKNECKFSTLTKLLFFLSSARTKSFSLVLRNFCFAQPSFVLDSINCMPNIQLDYSFWTLFFLVSNEKRRNELKYVHSLFFFIIVELNYVNGFASPHTRNSRLQQMKTAHVVCITMILHDPKHSSESAGKKTAVFYSFRFICFKINWFFCSIFIIHPKKNSILCEIEQKHFYYRVLYFMMKHKNSGFEQLFD